MRGNSSGSAAVGATVEPPTPTPTTVSGLAPATGSLVGGTLVAITGTGLASIASATVGGVPVKITTADGTSASFVTPAATNFQAASAALILTQSSGEVVADTGEFAYDALTPIDNQMQYLFQYWQNYNSVEWGTFSDNDCGNFVNQGLVARGWEQNNDWFSDYATTGDYSLSWIRGNEMDAYLASRSDTTRIAFEDRANVKIGDVVMFDWDPQNMNGVDHTMTVSGVSTKADGTPSIKLVGHTVDAQYRDFDTAITVDNPGGTAHFWSTA